MKTRRIFPGIGYMTNTEIKVCGVVVQLLSTRVTGAPAFLPPIIFKLYIFTLDLALRVNCCTIMLQSLVIPPPPQQTNTPGLELLMVIVSSRPPSSLHPPTPNTNTHDHKIITMVVVWRSLLFMTTTTHQHPRPYRLHTQSSAVTLQSSASKDQS